MGCDFATKSCMELMEDRTKNYPFCRTMMHSSPKTSCTYDRSAVGSCNLIEFDTDLPDIYQNFKSLPGVDRNDIGSG